MATYFPTFRACSPLMQAPYVPKSFPRALRNIRHLNEWSTSSEGAAVSHSEIKCCKKDIKKHTYTKSSVFACYSAQALFYAPPASLKKSV